MWRKLIVAKYGEVDNGWVPSSAPRYRASGVWGNILKFGDVSFSWGSMFSRGWGFIVWEEDCIRFWVDDWVLVGLLSISKCPSLGFLVWQSTKRR